MKLLINGEERVFPDPAPSAEFTLSFLIESLNMKSDRVAVELNREIAPRDSWPQTILKDGDRLEIVHFVGGGCSVEERPSAPRKDLANNLGFAPEVVVDSGTTSWILRGAASALRLRSAFRLRL